AVNVGYSLDVDLSQQCITTPGGERIEFEVEEFRKFCLLNGLDDIGETLADSDAIVEFERRWRIESPWLFDQIPGVHS
ncbi:MAG: 3-isopropylmalate/(R)-2-methylmalate dehydratase small subunit, partial [Halieaceae bacterium]